MLNQTLHLLPEKAIFWEEENMLIIADVHLGKSGHFRKHGIAVPHVVNDQNLELLTELVNQWKPDTLLFLGDLFHSTFNYEWNAFKAWRQDIPELEVLLTIGNHDILYKQEYELLNISVTDAYTCGPFCLVHDIEEIEQTLEEQYIISGHIHPSVKIRGKGRQSVTAPCFYFGKSNAILPAFGHFTGTHRLKPAKGQTFYAVIEGELIKIVK